MESQQASVMMLLGMTLVGDMCMHLIGIQVTVTDIFITIHQQRKGVETNYKSQTTMVVKANKGAEEGLP